jgi:hypothetical protein
LLTEAFLGSNVESERGRLRSFGKPVWVHDYQEKDKLGSHAMKAKIVRHGVSYKTYRVMLENGHTTTALNPQKTVLTSQQPPIEIDPETSLIQPKTKLNIQLY